MSTSANIIFTDNYHKCDEDNLDKCVSQDFDYVRYGNQVYIHFDGYPEHILSVLGRFFRSDGAKFRSLDSNYLSAWFVAFYCLEYKVKYLLKSVNHDFYDYKDYYTVSSEDIFNVRDFEGIGFHKGEESDVSYTYVITNRDISACNVWIYDGNGNFIDLDTLSIGKE